jgi:hypothetical protein
MTTQEEKAMVLSLVRANLLADNDNLSWVPSYTTVRWVGRNANAVAIGGHWRRKALCTRSIAALQGTCRLEELHFDKDKTMKRMQQMPPRNKTPPSLRSKERRIVRRAFTQSG